jgi:VanZ family protein
MEYLQLKITITRKAELWDFIANILGNSFGMALFYFVNKRLKSSKSSLL